MMASASCVIAGSIAANVHADSKHASEKEIDVVSRTLSLAIAALCVAAATSALPEVSAANDCAQRCYAQENSCRRATKDSPTCGAQVTRCLQGCRAQR
jgi:hypothetical protein